MSLAEKREKLNKMAADGIALSKKGAALTTEERTQCDKLEADFDTLKAEIAADEKFEARTSKFENEQRELNTSAGRQTAPATGIDLTAKEARQYSLLRAIDLTLQGKALDGIEGEYNREIEKRTGHAAKGFYMPGAVAGAGRRALDTTTGLGGLNTVVSYANFIEILRAKAVVSQMGARIISGLVGAFNIPKATAKATFSWVTDGNAPSGSAATLGQVNFTEKHLAGYTDISRSFIRQTSMDAEAFVRDDLTKGIRVGLDAGALVGLGTGGEPTGLFNNSSIEHSSPSGAGGLTWGEIVSMETAVANANVEMDSGGYLANPTVKGYLKTTLESSVAGANYIWRPDNTVNGYKSMATTLIPSVFGAAGSDSGGTLSGLVYGNWSDLVIGLYGELDILVDPYTGSAAGTVRVVAHQSADVQVRHAESFIVVDDIVVS